MIDLDKTDFDITNSNALFVVFALQKEGSDNMICPSMF